MVYVFDYVRLEPCACTYVCSSVAQVFVHFERRPFLVEPLGDGGCYEACCWLERLGAIDRGQQHLLHALALSFLG